jgi:hypothetical protein
MSLPVKSQADLYDLFITVLQDYDPTLTDTSEGSEIDTLAGALSLSQPANAQEQSSIASTIPFSI